LAQQVSSYIHGLEPWQYTVSAGFTLRGHYTPPTGKPVIHFLHGNGFNGLVYEKFLGPLSKHFDIFLSNAQGHGDSDAGVRPFTDWDDSASSFTEVWQHYSTLWADVERIGIGHSFGGVNTLLMTQIDPKLFTKVFLLDPIIGSRSWSYAANGLRMLGLSKHLPLAKQALVRGTYWPDEEALWNYFYQRGTFKGWDDDCLRSYLNHAMKSDENGGFSLKCPPQIESNIFSSYSNSVWSSLAALGIPVHMIYGSRTYDFVRANLPKLALQYPFVEASKTIGGHCFMFEQPEQSSELLLSLLGYDA